VPTPQAVEKEEVLVNFHGDAQKDHDHSGAVEGVEEVVEDSASAETSTGEESLALHPVPRAIAKDGKVPEKMKQHLPRPDRRLRATTTGSGKGSSFFDFLREAREQTRTPAGEEDMVIKGGTTSPVYNEGSRKQNTPEPSTAQLEVRGTRCEGDWSDDWQPCGGLHRRRQYRTWRINDVGTDYKCESAFMEDGGKLSTWSNDDDRNYDHYLCGTGFHDTASYKKVGCYKDQKPPSRAMCPGTTECTLQVNADGAEKCARYCGGMMNVPGSTIYSWNAINATNAPHVYFALQGGIWCYCSNDLAKTKEWGEVYTCAQCTPGIADRPQSASDQANGLYCGADWTNSVYETPYPANHQNCPGGETFRRIVQWRDCNPDDDHDDDIAPVEGGSIFDAPPLPAPLPAPPLPAPQQPIPPPSTPTVQVVEKVDGTTKEKDCLSDIC